jgi:hypothetical protein
MKTEASQKPVPMDGALATALLEWSMRTAYRQPEDWVFASPKMSGTQPYWLESMLRRYVQPIAKRLSITKKRGIRSAELWRRFSLPAMRQPKPHRN